MAKVNKEEKIQKSYNGADTEAKGYPKTKSLKEKNLKQLGHRFMHNQQLIGITSLILGSFLIFNFLGYFKFFNYVILAIGVGLLLYGGWQLNLAHKAKKAIDWFQGYLEENKNK